MLTVSCRTSPIEAVSHVCLDKVSRDHRVGTLRHFSGFPESTVAGAWQPCTQRDSPVHSPLADSPLDDGSHVSCSQHSSQEARALTGPRNYPIGREKMNGIWPLPLYGIRRPVTKQTGKTLCSLLGLDEKPSGCESEN